MVVLLLMAQRLGHAGGTQTVQLFHCVLIVHLYSSSSVIIAGATDVAVQRQFALTRFPLRLFVQSFVADRADRADAAIAGKAWKGYELEAAYAKEYAGGDRVWWCIPPTGILLHSRLRPSNGEKENALQGCITEIVRVGAVTNLIVQVSQTRCKLHMDCPPHVVARNALQVGESVGVSLLERAIHLMPWQA